MKPVIICGGIGSKMWPESRAKSPKHFLPFFDGRSLFQINWDLLRQKFQPSDIFLQTNEVQAKIAKEQVPEVVDDNIIIEPELRNHGPATCLAAASLFKRGFEDEPFMLVQADVLREPGDKFLEMLEVCDGLIRREGKMITGGNRPEFAIMGIDYLIKGDKVRNEGEIGVFKIDKFLWRSTKEAVEELIKDGQALTHANHYGWTPRLFLEMVKRLRMEWWEPLDNFIHGAELKKEYAKMPKGPIEDVTQHMFTEGLVVELPFRWIDFGTWESVAHYLKDQRSNIKDEDRSEIEANDNFIRRPKGKYVALIGVNNLVVIDTGDALLIVDKSQSGKVGAVVDKLKEEGRGELL
ncbi:MAG: sugar phosphate nucleotidyltransferase [Candidatus Shapirobacteria bacterium]|jgi:mannose-1-phosphate guanylyltransferase